MRLFAGAFPTKMAFLAKKNCILIRFWFQLIQKCVTPYLTSARKIKKPFSHTKTRTENNFSEWLNFGCNVFSARCSLQTHLGYHTTSLHRVVYSILAIIPSLAAHFKIHYLWICREWTSDSISARLGTLLAALLPLSSPALFWARAARPTKDRPRLSRIPHSATYTTDLRPFGCRSALASRHSVSKFDCVRWPFEI